VIKLLKKIKSILKKNEVILTIWRLLQQYYYKYIFNDEVLIRKQFKRKMGRDINLKNPRYFNDKLQWLKLNWYDPLAAKCADKYEVRKIIKKKIGDEYLNEIYSVYNSVHEIDISKLPEKFVLKGTHGSGFNIICKNKSKMNWKKEKKKMKRWLMMNYYWLYREWVYKDIKPRIIDEKYLDDGLIGGLRDYKFYCFNGKADSVMVVTKYNDNQKYYFFDKDWNLLRYCYSVLETTDEFTLHKPNNLETMFKIAENLSSDFSFVRVDLYSVKNKIYFGELTFFPEAGLDYSIFKTTDELFGSKVKLDNIK